MKTQSKKIETQTSIETLTPFGKTELEKNPKVKFNPNDKIRVLVPENPKRKNKNSFENFQLYIDNPELTIQDFEQKFMELPGKNQTLKNPISWIKWDIKQGHIEII
jgi:hypothetical protein